MHKITFEMLGRCCFLKQLFALYFLQLRSTDIKDLRLALTQNMRFTQLYNIGFFWEILFIKFGTVDQWLGHPNVDSVRMIFWLNLLFQNGQTFEYFAVEFTAHLLNVLFKAFDGWG